MEISDLSLSKKDDQVKEDLENLSYIDMLTALQQHKLNLQQIQTNLNQIKQLILGI